MFSFSSTATLHHVTALPTGTTFAQALSALHNHEFLIKLDPEFSSYETLPPHPSNPDTKRYKVTDHMAALPKGLWDSTVSFEAEMTNTEDGILWIVKAPLGLVQTTTWRCLKTEGLAESDRGNGEWSLVEDVEIRANRMLVGTVRGKCEENWRGSHGKFCEHLRGKIGEEGGK